MSQKYAKGPEELATEKAQIISEISTLAGQGNIDAIYKLLTQDDYSVYEEHFDGGYLDGEGGITAIIDLNNGLSLELIGSTGNFRSPFIEILTREEANQERKKLKAAEDSALKITEESRAKTADNLGIER